MSRNISVSTELKRVGERRAKLAEREEALAKETREALARAQEENFPISRAVKLLGMTRSTAYRVYLEDSNAA